MSKTLRKLGALVLVLCLLACMAACTPQEEEKAVYEIALIPTEMSQLDDKSFNQSAYEGIVEYAKAHNIGYKVYEPASKSQEQYLLQINTAIENGAKVVVTPGFNFESTILAAQDQYPDTKFVLIDGIPNNGAYDQTRVEKVGSNTYSVFFSEEQAGFLAGYAIVKDGFRKLGFLGGKEFPAVVRFGYGFIQGAEYAAKELKLGDNAVEIKFGYCGDFLQTPQNQAYAASWYNAGTEVIFACGGAVGLSVMQAAQGLQNKWVIGVDCDQSMESERVITSSMKMMKHAVAQSIASFYNNEFPGGKSVILGAASDGIGLPIDSSRFRSFSKTDYEAIYQAIKTDENQIAGSISADTTKKASDFGGKHVKVVLANFK